MVDNEGILQHLRELNDSLRDWERYKKNMVLHVLVVSIQSSIDIANHLISEMKLRKPYTYRESFDILKEAKVLPFELGDILGNLAGFRNILIHVYWKLDLEEVYNVLINNYEALKTYETIIKEKISSPDNTCA